MIHIFYLYYIIFCFYLFFVISKFCYNILKKFNVCITYLFSRIILCVFLLLHSFFDLGFIFIDQNRTERTYRYYFNYFTSLNNFSFTYLLTYFVSYLLSILFLVSFLFLTSVIYIYHFYILFFSFILFYFFFLTFHNNSRDWIRILLAYLFR